MARETGLVTAVVRDCDKKSLAQIAEPMARELVGRAREGRMKPDDMVGGTFTISNLGMFDVERFHRHHQPAAGGDPGRGRRSSRCRW